MSNQEEQVIKKIERRKYVRLSEPRILPLDIAEARKIRKLSIEKSEWDKLVQITIKFAKQNRIFMIQNLSATLMRNRVSSMRLWMLNSYQSSLPERDREILILRIGWLCHSEYVWTYHVFSGKSAGLSDDDINHIMEGPNAEGWAPFDATLLRAVDELYSDAFISEITWKVLAERYNTHQLMDLVFIVGSYNMTAMAVNTFGVQLDKGMKGFPK